MINGIFIFILPYPLLFVHVCVFLVLLFFFCNDH